MHKIIVYSTPICPWCTRAKDFLRNHNIGFEDIDVSENQEKAQEMISKSGQMGVPVVEIDGNIVIGFDKEKIMDLLNISD